MRNRTLLTQSEIAKRLNEPIHRVAYVIRSRGIQPSGWAGNARVFSAGALEIIRAALESRHHGQETPRQGDAEQPGPPSAGSSQGRSRPNRPGSR
jgi:hypothetical protein